MTLLAAATPDQSEPGTKGNRGLLQIPQSSKTESSP